MPSMYFGIYGLVNLVICSVAATHFTTQSTCLVQSSYHKSYKCTQLIRHYIYYLMLSFGIVWRSDACQTVPYITIPHGETCSSHGDQNAQSTYHRQISMMCWPCDVTLCCRSHGS